MNQLQVRIVRLEPFRVVAFHAYGPSPELAAWARLWEWAGSRGTLPGASGHRVFGFNNPDPSPGSPNYGYEFWLELGADDVVDDSSEAKLFAGGWYAVTRCTGAANITDTWARLCAWVDEENRERGSQQWLEEQVPPLSQAVDEAGLTLDLYYPLVCQ
jgi:DNA gyrase inhibitor GyrI